jgi:hypothetical protein
MFYPGSGSITFLSRIRIPDPGGEKHRIPDLGSYCTLSTGYIKIGIKIKTTFFSFIVSGASFFSKKLKNKDTAVR